MTENGDPIENAIAESINGIINEEYLNAYEVSDIKHAKEIFDVVINLYNDDRPHMSILNLNQIHHSANPIQTQKLWKNYYQKNPISVNVLQD